MCRFVEFRIVHLVALSLFIIGHEGVEPVSPEDLTRNIAGPRLRGLTCRFDGSFQYNNQLKPILKHISSSVRVEGTVAGYLVHHCQRPNEEQIRVTTIGSHFQFCLILSEALSFLCHLASNQLRSNTSTDYVGFPHVSYPEHKTQFPVSLANDCVFGKEKSLGSVLGAGHLSEYDAHHEGLHHDPKDALDAHDEYGFWTFFRCEAGAVADGVLSFNAE